MASQSASTTPGAGSSSAPTVVQILANNRNPLIWKDFNLCLMSDNTKKAQCIHCLHFFSKDSNSTLKNHISHPHYEALKRAAEPGQSSMSRDGSIFVYNPDVLREQFTGLVIQRGLPFNHFDDKKTTWVFQKHLQPKYNHAKETMFPVLSHKAMDILSVQATSIAFESAFSISGRVLSIRRTRLTPASLEMCMCLKDHLDAQECKQDKSTLETPVDFEEEILDAEVQANKAIPLSDEEIALDAASSEDSMYGPGSEGEEAEANYGYDVYHDDYQLSIMMLYFQF
nr:zinc finger BED domain-containing protein RICESLEEPER 2 [Tanacetum cinerariifolium]